MGAALTMTCGESLRPRSGECIKPVQFRLWQEASLVWCHSVSTLFVRRAALVLAELQALLSTLLRSVCRLLAVRQAVAQTPQVLRLFSRARLVLMVSRSAFIGKAHFHTRENRCEDGSTIVGGNSNTSPL